MQGKLKKTLKKAKKEGKKEKGKLKKAAKKVKKAKAKGKKKDPLADYQPTEVGSKGHKFITAKYTGPPPPEIKAKEKINKFAKEKDEKARLKREAAKAAMENKQKMLAVKEKKQKHDEKDAKAKAKLEKMGKEAAQKRKMKAAAGSAANEAAQKRKMNEAAQKRLSPVVKPMVDTDALATEALQDRQNKFIPPSRAGTSIAINKARSAASNKSIRSNKHRAPKLWQKR